MSCEPLYKPRSAHYYPQEITSGLRKVLKQTQRENLLLIALVEHFKVLKCIPIQVLTSKLTKSNGEIHIQIKWWKFHVCMGHLEI